MYIPPHFGEDRVDVLHQLMKRHGFATLVTLGADGLIANHLPMILDAAPAPFGILRGHIARANPQWRETLAYVEALAIFQGPHAYITPNWYPTRQETQRVVPTWNYAVVHAHGPLRTFDDPRLLEQHLRTLTDRHEAGFPAPWRVDDVPEDFFQGMLKSIVGIEIPITRLEGKWKMSQNRAPADRAGVIEGLEASGDPDQKAVAGWVHARNK
ncbi:MAG: FMN-binding negative transcriptional regulator [Bryobacteraceae bacterium]